MLPLSSAARALIVAGPERRGRPGVRPDAVRRWPGARWCRRRSRPRRRRPRRRRCRSRVPVTVTGVPDCSGRAAGGRGDRRRSAASCRSTGRGHEAGLQGRGLGAHVGEQVDRRLLHVVIVRRSPAGRRGWRRGPTTTGRCPRRRPARRWGRGTASGCGSRVPLRVGRAVVLQQVLRRRCTCVARQVDQPGRTGAVVEVLVPLVAERAGRHDRRRRPGASVGDAGVPPEAQLRRTAPAPVIESVPAPLTMKIVPVSAFSGRPPSAGGLKRGSRQVPVHVGGSGGSMIALSCVSL